MRSPDLLPPSSNSNSDVLRIQRFLLSPLFLFVPANLIIFLFYTLTGSVATLTTQLIALLNLVLVVSFPSALGVPELGRLLRERIVRRIVGVEEIRPQSSGTRALTSATGLFEKPEMTKAASDADSGVDLNEVQDKLNSNGAIRNPLSEKCDELVSEFLSLTDANSDISWQPVFNDNDIEILKHPTRAHFYKITALFRLPYSPALYTLFDFYSDIDKRSEWDDLCVKAYTVKRLNPSTKITFFHNKGIGFTAARDAVLLSHVRRLDDGKRLLNVTQSTDMLDVASDPGVVRMDVGIAGQTVELVDKDENGEVLRLTQVVNGDPKGSLPTMVVNLVATKFLPGAVRKVQKILADAEPKLESTIIPSDDALEKPLPESTTSTKPSEPIERSPIKVFKRPTPTVEPSFFQQVVTTIYSGLKVAQPVMTTIMFVTVLSIIIRRKSIARSIAAEVAKSMKA